MKTKSVLLIGLGRFGKYIAMKLHELGHEIMAVDENEERVNDAMPFVTNGQIGDSTNEALLKSLGVKNYGIGGAKGCVARRTGRSGKISSA